VKRACVIKVVMSSLLIFTPASSKLPKPMAVPLRGGARALLLWIVPITTGTGSEQTTRCALASLADLATARAIAAPPWQAEWAIPSRRATKAAIAERRKFSALLKMVRAGLI
jgi:hypothetical protein